LTFQNLTKVALLQALWNETSFASWFASTGWSTPPFDLNKAKEVIQAGGYIDYFCGKPIKTDISKDTVDPWLYDRDANKGAFARVCAKLKFCKK